MPIVRMNGKLGKNPVKQRKTFDGSSPKKIVLILVSIEKKKLCETNQNSVKPSKILKKKEFKCLSN